MNHTTLHKTWIIKATPEDVFGIMADFKNFPKHFPKVAQSIDVLKKDGNHLEMEATVKSFGSQFRVKMKTEILPGRGFISDNDSYQFGTSGHEELLISPHEGGALIDYTYQVTIHKAWLRVVATPLIKWYSMKFWEKAVIDELKKIVEKGK